MEPYYRTLEEAQAAQRLRENRDGLTWAGLFIVVAFFVVVALVAVSSIRRPVAEHDPAGGLLVTESGHCLLGCNSTCTTTGRPVKVASTQFITDCVFADESAAYMAAPAYESDTVPPEDIPSNGLVAFAASFVGFVVAALVGLGLLGLLVANVVS